MQPETIKREEVVKGLRELATLLERAPSRMTPGGSAVKALVPARMVCLVEAAADQLEQE